MPTSSAGRASSRSPLRRGVTLIEMMVVVSIMALMIGVSFPAIASGIDSLRINAASQSVVAFLNSALNRAERRQQAVEVTISKGDNALFVRSLDPGYIHKLELPEGVTISRVLPENLQDDPAQPRAFLLYPGGTVPRIGIVLINRSNSQRLVQVDQMTGVPQVSLPK